MPAKYNKTPTTFLNQPTLGLAPVFLHAQKLQTIQAALHSLLPATLKHQITVMNLKKGILIIQCENASLLTTLRHGDLDLLQGLRKIEGCHTIRSIEYRVRPATHYKTKIQHSKGPSSTEGAKQINITANNIEHPALKKALGRLAKSLGGCRPERV